MTLVAHVDDVEVDAIGAFAFGSSEPMRCDTIFRIASLTKPILATATPHDPDEWIKRFGTLMSQTSDVMWNGTLNEFSKLAANP